MRGFTVTIMIMIFYSFGITIFTHSLPAAQLDYVTSFSDLTNDLDLQSISNDFESSVEETMNIPLIELGALVFYSGNILIDLLMNFLYAIPQMIALFLQGLCWLFNFPSAIIQQIELFSTVLITVMYFIGLIQLVMNIRSQGAIL